jgi:hypothetical protein
MGLDLILAALVSAVSTLCAALGGIALTSGLEMRRQQRAAAIAAASERSAVKDQARSDLLAAITRLRVDIELTCARHWRDMNVRLAAIQEQALTANVLAAQVALLSPGPEADIAFALGKCASGLAALTAKSMTLGDFDGPNKQFMAGEITGTRPDFAELERLVAAFLRHISPGQPVTESQTAIPAATGGVSRPTLTLGTRLHDDVEVGVAERDLADIPLLGERGICDLFEVGHQGLLYREYRV